MIGVRTTANTPSKMPKNQRPK